MNECMQINGLKGSAHRLKGLFMSLNAKNTTKVDVFFKSCILNYYKCLENFSKPRTKAMSVSRFDCTILKPFCFEIDQSYNSQGNSSVSKEAL